MLRLCPFRALRAPVPYAEAVPRALLRFFVAMLRLMLRLFSRKLLILKQCYMLRFFLNVYGGQIGKGHQQVQIILHYILGRPYI